MKKLILETTAPFQGLPELVAYDEGLFAKEGLEIAWADREAGVEKKVEAHVTTPKGVDPFASHGRLLEQGGPTCITPANGAITAAFRIPAKAAGNSAAAPSSLMPRSWCGRIRRFIRRSSSPTAPSACRSISAPITSRCICSKALCRAETIRLCRAPNGSRYRLDALMRGEIEATTLTEPHVTLAEKKGCRIICSAFFHGTEVASDRVDAETYAAFNRAVREAVRRINADKKAYMHYFIDYYANKDPDIAALKVEDLREGRLVVCDPAPIPLDELQRTYAWLKSWGMLEETASPLQLVNMPVQTQAHVAAK